MHCCEGFDASSLQGENVKFHSVAAYNELQIASVDTGDVLNLA